MAVRSILVVDDDPKIRDLMRAFFEGTGYVAHIVGGGREAQQFAATHDIDLVLTDMAMPEYDGIDLILELRRSKRDVKIIAMTGPWVIRAEEYLNQARGLSVDGILTKPFVRQQLLGMIEGLLPPEPLKGVKRSINKPFTAAGTSAT